MSLAGIEHEGQRVALVVDLGRRHNVTGTLKNPPQPFHTRIVYSLHRGGRAFRLIGIFARFLTTFSRG